MRLRVFAFMLLFVSAATVGLGQTPVGYVTINGAEIMDSTNTPISNATISFQPVNNAGVPISFRAAYPTYGQRIFRAVTAQVTGGTFGITVADTAATAPANVCYNVTITDNITGVALLGPGYTCVQPAAAFGTTPPSWCVASTVSTQGGSCNFDLYVPNLSGLVITQIGPTGPAGPAGATGPAGPSGVAFNARGAWAATTAYAVNDLFTEAGTAYIVMAAYTSGSSFGSTDTSHAAVVGGYPGVAPDGSNGLVVTNNLQAATVTASVNTQLNVMNYGAKGDCSTDDHAAIVAAQTAAQTYAVGSNSPAALYFPKPPGGCYLTSTVQWTGVSLIGQPSGVGIGSPTTAGVVIKGKPGQDVMHVPDPSVTSYLWNATWTVRDITFMEDTNSAGSFPHRWPGRWFDDGAMTSGSAKLVTTTGSIGCSDIGQAVQINGAGASGANLVTTIANVDPCWGNVGSSGSWKVITLAASASTTVSSAHGYISVLGLPVTTTIGACAIAMDDEDANSAHWVNPSQSIGSLYSTMDNVSFIGFDGPANNACGLFVQGAQGLYGLNVTHSHVQYEVFGIVQGTAELNSAMTSDAGDFETWKNLLFGIDVYPWISYNGGDIRWEDAELTVQAGPQFLTSGNIYGDTAQADTLNISEFETWGTPTTIGLRLAGVGFTLNTTELSASGMNTYFDSSGSTCNNCYTGGFGSTLYLYGFVNNINGLTLGDVVVDKGRGNTVTGNYSASYLDSLPLDSQFAFTPLKNDNTVNSFLPSFLDAGFPTMPYKNTDMWLWPKDFIVGYSSGTPWSYYYQDDANSLTGGEFYIGPSDNYAQWYQFPASNTYSMTVGQQIPAGPGNFYFRGLCPVGASTEDIGVTTSGGYTVAGTQSCSTTLQNYVVPYNFTGQTGNVGIKNFIGTGFWLAWGYFSPSPVLNNGTTATTQTTADTSLDVATDAFVHNALTAAGSSTFKTTWTLGTTAVSANTCVAQTAVSVSGLTTGAAYTWVPSANYTAVAGFSAAGPSLYFASNPTSGQINWSVCNSSSSSITPGASTTWNVGGVL